MSWHNSNLDLSQMTGGDLCVETVLELLCVKDIEVLNSKTNSYHLCGPFIKNHSFIHFGTITRDVLFVCNYGRVNCLFLYILVLFFPYSSDLVSHWIVRSL